MSEIDDILSGKTPLQSVGDQPQSDIDRVLATAPSKGKGILGHVGDTLLSLGKSAIAVPETAVGLADIVSGGHIGKTLENKDGMFGFRPKEAKEFFSNLHTDQYKAQQQQFSDADGVIAKTGVALSNPSLITNAVAESIAPMLAGGVVARGLGAIAPSLSPIAAGAIGEGVVMAGSQAEQTRQQTDDGLLTPKQSSAAVATGGLGAMFGYGGGKLAKQLGITDVDTLIAQGGRRTEVQLAEDAAQLASRPAKSIPRKMIEGAISEGFLEELPQSISEQILQNLALDKPWSEGVEDAAVMGTLAGMAMGGGASLMGHNSRPSDPFTSPNAQQEPSVDQQPEVQPTLALPAPSFNVGPDGVVMTTADQNAAVQAQRQIEADHQDLINSGEITDVTPIPSSGIVPGEPSQIDSPVIPATLKLSEQMGLDPDAGTMSTAAALAVDSGASQQVASQQAQQQAAEAAEKQSKKGAQSLQAGELTSAAQLAALSTSVAEAALSPTDESTPVNQPIATKSKTTADQIKAGMEAMAKGYTEGAYRQIADYIEQGKTDRLTYSKPEAVESAKTNENYNIVENENGSVTVVGIKIGDQWVGVGRNNDSKPANHAQAWDNMTPAERMVVSANTDIKPIIARNMSKVAWDKINPEAQQKIASSMQAKHTDQPFIPPKNVNELADQWVNAYNSKDKTRKQELLNYGNQNFDQAAMTTAINGAMAKNTEPTAAIESAAPEANAKAQSHANIKAITAKQIPDMTDAELQQAADYYGSDHARTAKLNKAIEKRGISSDAPVFPTAQADTTQATPTAPKTAPKSLREGVTQAQENTKATQQVTKKPSKSVIVKMKEKARSDYFKSGNIVKSYGNTHDRVVSYSAPDDNGNWSVTVESVEKKDGQWVINGEPRVHQTEPDVREMRAGAIDRAPDTTAATENNLQNEQIAHAEQYELPKDNYRDWTRSSAQDFKPNTRQKRVMNSVKKALDSGLNYNTDVNDFVAKDLGVSDKQRGIGADRVEGGDFGMDVYYARAALDAQAGHKATETLSNELKLSVGDDLGTLVFNDGKQKKSVKVTEILPNGKVKVSGTAGSVKGTFETNLHSIRTAIKRAHEEGKRKNSYDSFIKRNDGAELVASTQSDIKRPNGEPFLNENAAMIALKKQELTETHEVVRLGKKSEFVLRPKTDQIQEGDILTVNNESFASAGAAQIKLENKDLRNTHKVVQLGDKKEFVVRLMNQTELEGIKQRNADKKQTVEADGYVQVQGFPNSFSKYKIVEKESRDGKTYDVRKLSAYLDRDDSFDHLMSSAPTLKDAELIKVTLEAERDGKAVPAGIHRGATYDGKNQEGLSLKSAEIEAKKRNHNVGENKQWVVEPWRNERNVLIRGKHQIVLMRTVVDESTNKESLSVGGNATAHTTIKSESGVTHSLPNSLIDQTHKLSDVVSDLASISSDSQNNEGQREHTQKLLNDIVSKNPDVKVRVVRDLNQVDDPVIRSGLKSGGYYDPKTNTAYIYPNAVEWEGNTSNLLNHELVHAMTARALSEGSVPKEILDGLDGIRAKIQDHLIGNYESFSEHVLNRLNRATENNDELLSVGLGEHDINNTLKDILSEDDLRVLDSSFEQISKAQPKGRNNEKQRGSNSIDSTKSDDGLSTTTARNTKDSQSDSTASRGSQDSTRVDSNRSGDLEDTEASKHAPEVSAKPNQNIQDFGEKLEGAKKDTWQTYEKDLSDDLPSDAKDIALSKHFPEPNYEELMKAGVSEESLAAVKAMRDGVPVKPRMASKLRRWVDQLQVVREFSSDVLSGKLSVAELQSELRKISQSSRLADNIDLYRTVGYPIFTKLNGVKIESGNYTMFNAVKYPEGITKWSIDAPNKRTEYFDTRDEVIARIKEVIASQEDAPATARNTKLDIYRVTKTGDIVIGKKVASNKYIDLKTGFKSSREASQYLAENQDSLLADLKKKKETPPTRRSTNDPRVGEDYRQGENVTPEKFDQSFGFRGVQFGNYVEGVKRQADLNNAYDGLMDLATLLNIPPKAISLNGELGMAFGARGNGGKNAFAAHYEPDAIAINMTKKNGSGTLAHEWWHALDNYFSRLRGKEYDFISARPSPLKTVDVNRKLIDDTSIRPEVLGAWDGVMKAIKASGMLTRAINLDGAKSKDYWSTDHELSARAFEKYIIDRSHERGESSDYLANIMHESLYDDSESGYKKDENPYPTNDEAVLINKAFQHLFDTLKTKETEKGIALFSRRPVGVSGATPVSELFGRLTPHEAVLDGRKRATVGDMLDHAQLFAAYPSLSDIPVGVMPAGENAQARIQAFATGLEIQLTSNMKRSDIASAILHELQHGIQNKEGFAMGGSRKAFISDYDKTGAQTYKRLAGEVEARNTQMRKTMTPSLRAQIAPEETADVSPDKVLVSFNGKDITSHAMPTNVFHPAMTEQGLQSAFEIKFPKLLPALKKMLARGKAGQRGGVVLLDSADPLRIAHEFSKKTGTPFSDSVQMFSEDGSINGFYDPKSGLTFLVGPNLDSRTGPSVLLHEMVHGQQRASIDKQALAMLMNRGQVKNKELSEFLDRVAVRMIDAGETANAQEATAYIVEQAVMEGQTQGFGEADSRFLSWVDSKLGQRVGDLIRSFLRMTRQWMLRNGMPIGNITVTDMINYAQAGLVRAAEGDVQGAQNGANFSLNEQSDAPFQKAIDDVVKRISPKRFITIGRTPDALRLLGLPDAKVRISSETIEKAMAEHLGIPKGNHSHIHNLTPEDMRQLPKQLNNPIAVFKSSEGAIKAGYVVLTELNEMDLKTGQNKPVIVALHVREIGGYADIVQIASAYGRSKSQIQTALNNDLLYWNKEKGQQFIDTVGLQLPQALHNDADLSKANIKSNDDLVNYQATNNVKFSRSGVRDIASKATAELNKRFSAPGKLSVWHKTVGTMYNLAERSPAFKPVFEAAQNFIDDVSFYASEAAALAPKILPKLEAIKDIIKQPISADDNKAISKPIFEGTLLWARDRDGTPVLVDTLSEAASKLSTERKAQILEATGNLPANLHKAWKALPAATYAKMIDSRYETTFLKPGVVWTDDELKDLFSLNDGQIALYHEFRDSLNQSLDSMTKADMLRVGGKDVKDMMDQVMSVQNATEASQLLIERLNDIAMTDPDRATSLFQAAQDIKNRVETTVGLQADGYAPLSRFGKYTVDVVEDGERQYFGLFETMHEANTMAAKLRDEFGEGSVSQGTLSAESYKLFAGITPESLELFGNMLGLESDGDKARDQAFQEYIRLTKNNRSAMKRLMHRKGVAGYSENVGRVLASFIYSNARQTAGGLHMGDLDEALQAIPKAQGELTDVAVKLREYIKNPQEEAQAIRGLLFAQYLGGSIASAIVNMTQPVAVTFPFLSQYGGARNAASQLAKAAKQMSGKGAQFEPELIAAMKHAEEDGTLSPQEVHQLMGQARGTGSLTSGDGTRAGDVQAFGQNSMTRFSLAWGKLFSAAEQINRRMTFIAAYRIAKEQGMDNADNFARHAVKETQFVYTKASKMQWGRGAIGGTLMTFKTYSISYLELMSRLWSQGEAGSQERQQGRKAALLMIATLLLLSGAGGLPFADDLDDLIDGLAQIAGYNFSSDKAKQEFLEETFGREAAAFINRGVTGLPGSPLDVSGRLGMGNLLPGTGLIKTKTDGTRDVMELLGPMGDLAKRGFSGARQIARGDVLSGLLEASPTAFRNLAKGVDMGATGMYRDEKGYKVLETNNLEAAMKAIGFQPASVAEIQRANFVNQGFKAFYNLNAQEIRAQWANGIFLKDASEVQAARDAITSWNENNPDQRMVISIASVLKKAKEMAKSKDQRIADTAPKVMRAQMHEDIVQRRTDVLN